MMLKIKIVATKKFRSNLIDVFITVLFFLFKVEFVAGGHAVTIPKNAKSKFILSIGLRKPKYL